MQELYLTHFRHFAKHCAKPMSAGERERVRWNEGEELKVRTEVNCGAETRGTSRKKHERG